MLYESCGAARRKKKKKKRISKQIFADGIDIAKN